AFDFIDEYLEDVAQARARPLAHYLARYADHQVRIAREYLALQAPESEAEAAVVDPLHATTPADTDPRSKIGPYRVERELGRGGQGTVYLAEDIRIARRVALKVLASRFEGVSDERRRRFRREAAVIARLEHPSLCGIYEAELEGETPYIAMRYVEGETLAERIARAKDSPASETSQLPAQMTLPPRSALEIHGVLLFFERTARALHAAHEAGVIHRDVKPGNIVVAPDGTPVVLDFGLARDELSELPSLTQSDETFGTPAYMSPEQIQGPNDALDRRSDVYSLGVTLYETLTLRRPFDALPRASLYRAIESTPAPDVRSHNRALSEDVKVVLETALEKDPARRYTTALAFAEDLRRIREYEPIQARPASVPLRLARWSRRNPATVATILALSVGLAIALTLLASEQRALRVALERQLAERAALLVAEDPSAALALGIEAAELAQTSGEKRNYLTNMALFAALDACFLRHQLATPGDLSLQITDLAVSPDSRAVAAAVSDGRVYVWDIDTGRELAVLGATGQPLRVLCYSPDGAQLAAGGDAGRVSVWSTVTKALEHEIDVGAAVTCVSYRSDGARLLVGGKGAPATLVDTTTWSARATLEAERGVDLTGFTTSGRHLVTVAAAQADESARVSVWESDGGAHERTLASESRDVTALAFHPDVARDEFVVGSRAEIAFFSAASDVAPRAPIEIESRAAFLVFSPDGKQLVWSDDSDESARCELVNLETNVRSPLSGENARRVTSAAFSPDGRRFATASYDLTVRIWDAADARELSRFNSVYRMRSVAWALDGRRLVTHTNAYLAHVWYAVNRPDTMHLQGHRAAVRSVCFSPDGTHALSVSDDGTARVWNELGVGAPDPGREQHAIDHAGPVSFGCFRPDGRELLTVSRDGAQRSLVRRFLVRDAHEAGPPIELESEVRTAQYDATGERILTVSADGVARLWTSADGVLLYAIERAACARIAHDGEWLVVGGEHDALGVHRVRDGERVREIEFRSAGDVRHGVVDVALLPGGELVAACRDKTLRFFDSSSGKETRPEVVLFDPKSLSWSASGERLLVLGHSGGGAVRVQDLARGRAVVSLNKHDADVTCASFSPGGELVLSGSRDHTAYVWDAEDGRPSGRIRGKSALVCAALSSAGGPLRAITGWEDGSVTVWPVDPLPAAMQRKPRELSIGERQRESHLALPLRYK
ncbi:MAG: WD40 repeat domain-containing serine/threonine protein kinase, partial [Planctomycetota bacterium]